MKSLIAGTKVPHDIRMNQHVKYYWSQEHEGKAETYLNALPMDDLLLLRKTMKREMNYWWTMYSTYDELQENEDVREEAAVNQNTAEDHIISYEKEIMRMNKYIMKKMIEMAKNK